MKPLLCGILAAALFAPVPAVHAQEPDVPVLSLDAAIAEALGRSPSLEPARESLALADIARSRAHAEFGFRVTPSWSTTTTRAGAGSEAGVSVERRLQTGTRVRLSGDAVRHDIERAGGWTGRYALTIAQPVFSLFSPVTTARLRDADRGLAATGRAFQDARRDLVIRVAQTYFAVVRQQRIADAARRARDRARQLREASDARTQVGLATRLDVLRADLLVSQASAQLDAQLEALADHTDQLKVLLGRPLDEPLAVDATAPVAGAGGPATADPVETLVAGALASRLDLHEMRDRVQDARRAASVAKWNLVPDITVEATYAAPVGDRVLFDGFRPGWSVRLGTTYALDAAASRATIAAAEIGTRAAERRLDDFAQIVEADVRRSARAVERAAAAITIHEKALALAGQQLALAQMRYERGLAGNFDVIDAESNLFQAETSLIAAQVDRALARLQLEKAAGRLDPERYLR